MAHFTSSEANAWLESTKLSVDQIETALEQQISEQILSQLRGTFTTSTTWTDATDTPALVRSVIAMMYCAALYERAYGEDHDDTDNYAGILRSMAMASLSGLLNGSLSIVEDDGNLTSNDPSFFPNDLSSAQPASVDAPSDGGPYFSMGMVF